jgi:hypothetical protein
VKIVRVPFAVSLALLAAAPAHAAVAPPPPPKPPADGAGDADRDAWRARGLAICMGEMLSAEGVGANDVRSACGCALDRFAAGEAGDGPPPIDPAMVRAQLGGPLLACAAELRTAAAAALARRLAQPPQPLVPPTDAKLPDATAPTNAEAPKPALPNIRTWLSGLSLPSWLADSGLPAWAWIVLAFLGFMLLRGLFRRDDPRDLVGPPSAMRLNARANSPPPPRADPPQRLGP